LKLSVSLLGRGDPVQPPFLAELGRWHDLSMASTGAPRLPRARATRLLGVNRCLTALALAVACSAGAEQHAVAQAELRSGRTRPQAQPQTRVHSRRIDVDGPRIQVNDGDTISIRWNSTDIETIRILGVDAPETGNPEHDIPLPQSFGMEARSFAEGAFAGAARIELLRAATLDPYGRTLAYVFLGGQNYSVMIVKARLAEESITRFGDNGFPAEASAIVAAAKDAGPLPFESPTFFRARMRKLAEWMRQNGHATPGGQH
jgi:micrococcal nuclease